MNSQIFKDWFGKSRIVDSKNMPLVLYHGTENDFTEFNENKIGSKSRNNGILGKGFYFTKDLYRAQAYGNMIIHAYLRIENPFVINGKLDKSTVDIINRVNDTYAFEEGMDYTDIYKGFSYSIPECPEIAELIAEGLQSYGYDGIIYGPFEEVVCFEADQIYIIKKEVRK